MVLQKVNRNLQRNKKLNEFVYNIAEMQRKIEKSGELKDAEV